MGPVAASAARASDAADVLAAGGVRSLSAGATTGVADAVAAYRRLEPPTPVVCLAGPDPAYAGWGAPLVAALREAGAAYVVLAGRPGDDTVPAALLDDSFDAGTDVLALLQRVREVLQR
jgi:methylmalonyl-CoA mutase